MNPHKISETNNMFFEAIIKNMKRKMKSLHVLADWYWSQKNEEKHREYCVAANDMMAAIRLISGHANIIPF